MMILPRTLSLIVRFISFHSFSNSVVIWKFTINGIGTSKESLVKGLFLREEFAKFGGRYQNQVPSNQRACPGIHRKSIALDQKCIIQGSVLKLKARVGRIRQTKIKFELFGVSVVGIARKMVLLAKWMKNDREKFRERNQEITQGRPYWSCASTCSF
jgi:hypothetical protein